MCPIGISPDEKRLAILFRFRDKDAIPEKMKICKKGTWNECMCVETVLSMLTIVCDLKRIHHRPSEHMQDRLAYVVAMFNVHLKLVQELLGHSSIVVTLNRYSHLINPINTVVADTLDDAVSTA